MDHLKDLYDKKGQSFISDLFSGNVYITEKIDGSRFAFKKLKGELVFYKRDAKNPISLVDRAMMKFYEPAITYIESLNIKSIPEDILFGFEYFANKQPGSIVYDKIPKNGLILTDLVNGGSFTTNITELTKWSKKFNVTPPPVIFNGKLPAKVKVQMVDFLTTEWDDLFQKFETESFTSYIISILNPKLKNTALNIGTSKPIEGIVFSFDKGDKFINAKLVDPMYTKSARQKSKSKFTDARKDTNKIKMEILRGILTSMKTYEFPIPKSKNKDIKFIELISSAFFDYYSSNKGKFQKVPVDPGMNDNPQFDLNYKFINHPKLSSVLKKNPKVKLMFKSMLSSFGKTRKRATTTIDKSMLSDLNPMIQKVNKLSEQKIKTDRVQNFMDIQMEKLINIG